MTTRFVTTADGCREAIVVQIALGERSLAEGDVRGYIAQQLESWFASAATGDSIRPNAHSFGIWLAQQPNLYETGF